MTNTFMDDVEAGPEADDLSPKEGVTYCAACDCMYEHGDWIGDNGWHVKFMHQNYVDWCCSDECSMDYDREGEEGDYEARWGNDLIDGVGFADPGGTSALRAATPENPRNLPCPTCGRPNMLTPLDVARHYQCDICADSEERGGGY